MLLWKAKFAIFISTPNLMLDLKNLGGIMKVHLTLFRAIALCVLTIFLLNTAFAQPDTLWTKTFGGSRNDGGSSVQQTSDGGYIITGSTSSYGAGSADVWLIKTDASGDTIWTKIFGGSDSNYGYSVQQTSDGGYIITGVTYSYDAGRGDVWLIKTDAIGDTIWTKTFGGSDSDYGNSVQQTSDGGYIITGYTYYYGAGSGDVWLSTDVWLIKTDASGDTIWTKTFGGSGTDKGNSVQQTSDGGYIITGSTYSYSARDKDIWLIKTDAIGDTIWTKTFGGSERDFGNSVQQTSDGGYIITGSTGYTSSYGGNYDVWLVKVAPSHIPHTILTFEEIIAPPGDTVTVPLHINIPNDSTYSSFCINFYGYIGKLEFIDIDTSSSMISEAGWIININETDSLLITASAGAMDIYGKGLLLGLKFAVPDTASGFIPITIASALFDESDLYIELNPGGIKIINYGDVSLNSEVTHYDASLILKYLVGDISLNNQQLKNANVSMDTTVSALDASLILQNVVGLIDSLPYDTTSGLLLASGDIGMEDGIIQANQSVDVPLFLSNGNNILAFEGLITFNTEHLIFDSLSRSELLEGFTIETNVENGKIKIAGAGSLPDGQEGIFVTLRFIAVENFSDDRTAVTLNRLRWNEESVIEDVATAVLSIGVGISDNHSGIPTEFALSQNYPNPFNPSTTILYQLPKSTHVKLSIYDITGKLVETLVNEYKNAGYYSIEWNAENSSSGIYLYRIDAGEFSNVRKCLIVK